MNSRSCNWGSPDRKRRAPCADRIVTLLSEPYDIDGQLVEIGASVGIALAPIDGETADQLLTNADIALYQAKEDGRRTYCFFQPRLGASIQAHHTLALDLRNALGAGELEVYYQPLVKLETGVICGFEALLRWHHPLARDGGSGEVHSARRGDRLDCPDRRMGAASSLRRSGGDGRTI